MLLELTCLAMTVYYEARSEPLVGQVAVAQVVMQRVESWRYPDTVCEVTEQGGDFTRGEKCQFSFHCDGLREDMPDLKARDKAYRVADAVMNGGVRHADLIGVLNYHADYVEPSWSITMVKAAKIGRHWFYLRGI